jgi:hypothetical protein
MPKLEKQVGVIKNPAKIKSDDQLTGVPRFGDAVPADLSRAVKQNSQEDGKTGVQKWRRQ